MPTAKLWSRYRGGWGGILILYSIYSLHWLKSVKDPLLYDLMGLMTDHWGHTLQAPLPAPLSEDGADKPPAAALPDEPPVAAEASGVEREADTAAEPQGMHLASRANLEAARQAILNLDGIVKQNTDPIRPMCQN